MDVENTPNTPPAGEPKKNSTEKAMWLVAGILIILAAGWYIMGKSNKNAGQIKSNNEAENALQQQNGQPMSLRELMALGKSQKCEFNFSADKTQTQSTVYFGKGKMRGDFAATVDGKQMVSHMINDGSTIYTWIDGSSMAFKISAQSAEDKPGQTSDQSNSQSVDVNAKYNYNCSSWPVNDSLLTPPANITFTDQNELLKQAQEQTVPTSGASGSSAQCAACNSLSENQRASCLAALKCN